MLVHTEGSLGLVHTLGVVHMAHSRVTVSLPPEVAADLDYLSRVMGMSRSAIVSDVLEDAFRPLIALVDYHGAADFDGNDSASPQFKRLRGASAEYIRQEFARLRRESQSINLDPDSFALSQPADGED
jgi:predicted transcriptional regulator